MSVAVTKIRKYVIALMSCLMLSFSLSGHPMDVYVIANTGTVKTKSLSYSEIEDIFTLRSKRWSDGTSIKVFLLPRNHQRTWLFTTKYLNMTPNRYYDLLESRESSGKGNVFQTVESEYEIMMKILNTPGSIGYASESIIINTGTNLIIVK